MVKYELKKMLSRTGSRAAFGILGVVLLIAGYFAVVNITYVNEQGVAETGPAAIHKLKEKVREWEGNLTEERIAEVIEKDRKIRQTKEWQSTDVQQNDMAYSRMLGYYDIYRLLVYSYCDFREYDYYRPETLTAADAPRFYENRVNQLQKWLDTEAKEKYSESEKEFLLTRYREMEKPLYYEFHRGWTQFFEYAPTVQMFMVFVLGYLLAGLFAREVQLKTDAVFFTSCYGRNKAVHAKILAGAVLTTVVYWGTMLLYSLLVLGIIGFDGASCMIQVRSGWKSFYNITMLQEYLLILCGGYIGILFFAFLTMLISAKTKSSVLAVMTPFILIFLPSFLPTIEIPVISKVIGLLPDQLLQIGQALLLFETYSVGDRVMGSVPILLVGYGVLSTLLYPLVYRVFRRMEVK